MTFFRFSPRALLLRAPILALLAISAFSASPAAETANASPLPFGIGVGRAPRPGDWLDYVACFQADPLERSLAPHAVAAENTESAPPPDPTTGPEFDTPVVWTCAPLRLEIHQVAEDGANASLTYGGLTKNIFLPLPRKGKSTAADEAGPQSDGTTMQQVGGENLEVTIERGGEGPAWYIRYQNRDIPFGLTRFSCENLDLVLVNHGEGLPPELPVQPQPILPLPGGLAPKRQ